jgi:hypothetical protein
MRKFQNINFEKPVILKVAHDYKNKTIVLRVLQLFKILRSSTRASALNIELAGFRKLQKSGFSWLFL